MCNIIIEEARNQGDRKFIADYLIQIALDHGVYLVEKLPSPSKKEKKEIFFEGGAGI